MKNLVFVVAAVVAVVVSSSSANASNSDAPVKFCVLKQTAEITVREVPELQVIMVVDDKYPMGLKAGKVSGQESTTSFSGGYGVLTDAGIVEAREVDVQVVTDDAGVDVKTLTIKNNKTMSSAFQISIQDLQKDPVGEEQMKTAGQPAQCYTGSIALVKGLEV